MFSPYPRSGHGLNHQALIPHTPRWGSVSNPRWQVGSRKLLPGRETARGRFLETWIWHLKIYATTNLPTVHLQTLFDLFFADEKTKYVPFYLSFSCRLPIFRFFLLFYGRTKQECQSFGQKNTWFMTFWFATSPAFIRSVFEMLMNKLLLRMVPEPLMRSLMGV